VRSRDGLSCSQAASLHQVSSFLGVSDRLGDLFRCARSVPGRTGAPWLFSVRRQAGLQLVHRLADHRPTATARNGLTCQRSRGATSCACTPHSSRAGTDRPLFAALSGCVSHSGSEQKEKCCLAGTMSISESLLQPPSSVPRVRRNEETI
jgi:hypothetical protein